MWWCYAYWCEHVSSQDQERRAASQLKAQSKERQFFDGRFKELLKRFENLEAENFVLKHRLGTEYQSEDHRQYRAPRSRSHSQESRRSHSSGRQQKSTLEVNVADPDEKRTITFEKRILRRARRSFLQEFRYATTIPENPLSGRESPSSMDKQSENSASTTVVLDSDAAPQKHLSVSKKPRTSPDLLKDHNQRVTFDSPPSGPRSGNPVEVTEGFDIPQRLPDEIQKVADQMSKRSQSPERTRNKSGNFIETSDTIVRPNQQPVISKDKNLRHDLLEKIRLLDLGKRAGLSGGGDGKHHERDDLIFWFQVFLLVTIEQKLCESIIHKLSGQSHANSDGRCLIESGPRSKPARKQYSNCNCRSFLPCRIYSIKPSTRRIEKATDLAFTDPRLTVTSMSPEKAREKTGNLFTTKFFCVLWNALKRERTTQSTKPVVSCGYWLIEKLLWWPFTSIHDWTRRIFHPAIIILFSDSGLLTEKCSFAERGFCESPPQNH